MSNAFSITSAAISAPMPAKGQPSSTVTRRLVFSTEASTASPSSGRSERRSITSASMPSAASVSAASNARPTMIEKAATVTSLPVRATAALPMGTRCSPSAGTSKLWP